MRFVRSENQIWNYQWVNLVFEHLQLSLTFNSKMRKTFCIGALFVCACCQCVIQTCVAGAILGRDSGQFSSMLAKWQPVLVYFLANTGMCTLSCLALLLNDMCFSNCRLNQGKRYMRTSIARLLP